MSAGTSLYTIILGGVPVNSAGIDFSNSTYFNTEIISPATPANNGEWRLNAGNTITWFWDEALPEDLGSIRYFFTDYTIDSTGLYSIDYRSGTIYTNTTVLPTASGIFYCDYSYSNYEFKYPLARIVPQTEIQVDETNKVVSVSAKEALKNLRVASGTGRTIPGKYYQITYDYIEEERIDLQELEPYFTPILKDYVLKILTAGRLI